MKKTTRRDFIKKSGFTLLTVGLSGPAFGRTLNRAAHSALTRAAALSPTDNILVVIQLDGGNDGLNTVIPLSDPLNSLYKQYRSVLEIADADILPIGADDAGNQLGLHPSLQQIKNLFDQGRVGVIQAVGYENQNRSHFTSQDIWHSANLTVDATGWLGDYLDVTYPSNENPLIAAAIGGKLPLTLRADHTAVPAINSIESYRFQTDPRFPGDATNKVETFLALNQEGASDRVLYEHIRQTALDAYGSAVTLQEGAASYTPDPGIVYNEGNRLARAMQQAAQIIGANLGTKILYVSLGGFDTHQTQANAHATLLGNLSDAVDTFYRDMQRLGLADRVLMMTWSEFGRKVRENGNQGTDHGASAPQFVFGNAVKRGITGVHPNLADLNPGLDDTKYAIDFRAYYATILEKWLGVDAREILGGAFDVLDFI